MLERLGEEPLSQDEIVDRYVEHGRALAPHLANTSAFVEEMRKKGKNLLFEGAQGAMLDNQGRVAAEGDHASLLATCPVYRALWSAWEAQGERTQA